MALARSRWPEGNLQLLQQRLGRGLLRCRHRRVLSSGCGCEVVRRSQHSGLLAPDVARILLHKVFVKARHGCCCVRFSDFSDTGFP